MCCIFTCCGWMVDLIQRLWTFTMSCFISSAVCCSLVTASMSGVALGYNYSLAEYIDLKETNVSVYLKRGVFDDEIGDDMAWRRSGHQPIAGHIKDSNLMTGDSDESKPLRPERRLDDSIYESNDRSNFEGSLMRLTAKPIDPGTTLPPIETPLDNVLSMYTMGSLDQLKAVQGVINKKKAEAVSGRRSFNKKIDDDIVVPERRPIYSHPESGRRAYLFTMPSIEPRSTYGSLRAAVPDDRIGDPSKWTLPKLSPESLPVDWQYIDSYRAPTYPSPVTPRAGPARPTRPPAFARPRSKPTPTHTTLLPTVHSKGPEMNLQKSIDEDIEAFKKKLMEDKFMRPRPKDEDFLKKMDVGKIKPNDDYDEDLKGVPMRKKRNIYDEITPKNNSANETKVEATKDLVNTTTKLDATVGKIEQPFGDNQNKTDILGREENEVTKLNIEKSPMNVIIKIISSATS